MATICPAVLAGNPHDFREQIERVAAFARRLHIDLTDGRLAENRTIAINQAWWPDYVQADVHLMHKQPEAVLTTLLRLKPHLVIVHAESEGSFLKIAQTLRSNEIKVGIALLHDTHVSTIEPVIDVLDHVLVFSGNLGHYGGKANMHLVGKVSEIKNLKSNIEVGWDGGINAENIKTLVHNGVDVLDVGGFIQKSSNPEDAYAKLRAVLRGD